MRIAIASDHGGVELKKYIIENIKKAEFIDCSSENFDTDDYPDFAFKVCQEVLNSNAEYGILICGTGIGMSITANKIKGIRCALVHSIDEAQLAKEHNDANVIAFSKNTDKDLAVSMVEAFITAKRDDNERHARRRQKVLDIEAYEYNEL